MGSIDVCLNCKRVDCPGVCDAMAGASENRTRRTGERNIARRYYTAFGETESLYYFATKYKLRPYLLYNRVNRYGMTMEEAITKGQFHVPTYEAFGRKMPLSSWAEEFGISPNTLKYRIHRMGMPLEAALMMKPMTKRECARRPRKRTARGTKT